MEAKYYVTGEQAIYEVTNFMEMLDVSFDDNGQYVFVAQRPC